jgi:Family of unknown function (DUF5677)
MLLEGVIRGFEERVAILERVIEIFSGLVSPPTFVHTIKDRHFQCESPDVRHFCLLKAVRVVSSLNAAFELARKGYTQELTVLMRILSECTHHIEYVLDPDDDERHKANVKKYLQNFFEDRERDPEAEIKGVLIREKVINEQLGKTLDKIAAQYGDTKDRVPAAKLFHRSSRAVSFYVHARYPESMDLYGGTPGRFHLRGMRGTPKDRENLETLDTFIDTASTTFVIMVQGIPELRATALKEPMLYRWYAQAVRRTGNED